MSKKIFKPAALLLSLLFGSLIVFTSLPSFADVNWAHGKRPVVHQFTGDETVWFLSKVYYGNSKKFERILLANALTDPHKIPNNTWLLIPSPKFSPWKKAGREKHSMRYTELYQVRAAVLAAKELNKHENVAKTSPKEKSNKRHLNEEAHNESARMPASTHEH